MVERLAFSGWMASGKDTVAAEVMRGLGQPDAVRMSYADPIRREMRLLIRLLRAGVDHADAAAQVGCTPQNFQTIAGILAADLAADPDLDPDHRTVGMRRALQHWGTDVRRAADEQYWVRASLADAELHAEAGRSVYYTDLRFPNEVSALARAGYFTVRIDVSRDTQSRRLASRDSLVGGTALHHPSETALDNHPSFHLRVRNDGELHEAVTSVLTGYSDWKERRDLLAYARRREA